MTTGVVRALLALAAPLVLTACLITPGKFNSTLSINADRSFSFAYKGEVISIDPSSGLDGLGEEKTGEDGEDGTADETPVAFQSEGENPSATGNDAAEKERKYRALADALSREEGYRSVEYVGGGKFLIDYQISGRLDYNFVYPYNLDAEIMFPFVAIEVRKNGTVRVKAPAFGNESTGDGTPGRSEAADHLDGTFTLDTDAEIVSQNNEEGYATSGGRKVITWQATPLNKSAPMAVLRMQ